MKLTEAVDALTGLAQESRLEIFRLLVRVGPEGLCAGDVADELGVGKSTLSFHLKELERAKLIVSERRGRSINYRLNDTGVNTLFSYLMEDCCQGRPELCSSALNTKCC